MMKSRITSGILFATITLLIFSFFPGSNTPQTIRAAPSDFIISPSVATPSTYAVYLSMDISDGIEPEVSRWYGPDGSEVVYTCRPGDTRRIYENKGGVLVWVRDFFYVSGCNRELGQYKVEVGNWSGTFEISATPAPQEKIFLPLVQKSPEQPAPPGEFSKLSPADGVTGLPFSLNLDWGDSDGASSYDYCYDTTDDSACTNWFSTGTTSQAGLSGLIADTTYYWQARATNNLGTSYADGDASMFWSFTTGGGSVTPSEMILIPAGELQMGCDPDHNLSLSCYAWELPLHTVYLDAFKIDKYEVTNAQYAQCVVAGACQAPSDTSSYTRPSYYGNPDYADYPVINVTWQDAVDYCTWAGARLPTEAEWEMAGRGPNIQAFPWGDAEPTCTLVNYSESFSSQCVGDTSPVGDYPLGASPYGVLDMAGNVREWVNDRYAADYYEVSPLNNPPGPDSGEDRVVRGGGYGNMGQDILVAGRSYGDPGLTNPGRGFRCAVSEQP